MKDALYIVTGSVLFLLGLFYQLSVKWANGFDQMVGFVYEINEANPYNTYPVLLRDLSFVIAFTLVWHKVKSENTGIIARWIWCLVALRSLDQFINNFTNHNQNGFDFLGVSIAVIVSTLSVWRWKQS